MRPLVDQAKPRSSCSTAARCSTSSTPRSRCSRGRGAPARRGRRAVARAAATREVLAAVRQPGARRAVGDRERDVISTWQEAVKTTTKNRSAEPMKRKDYDEGARAAARRAGQAAGVGQAQGAEGLHRVRGPRRRRQGRHDQGDHRAREPARVPRGRAARADRAREEPDVHAALPAAPAGRRRGRDLRPQLVQPRRRRARDGLLHRGAGAALPRRSCRWSRRRWSSPASSCSSTGSR